nr:topless-related protein 4 [Ipomoea batatas]
MAQLIELSIGEIISHLELREDPEQGIVVAGLRCIKDDSVIVVLFLIEAANGLQAWRVLEDLTNHIDLVLTELEMPCVSGIGLLCKIMSHKTRKNVPVALSATTMTTFMAPPPAATSLAFHPQDNNVIAIGMDDSSIQIYNVRVDEVKSKLKGHQKRVTGLAFSNVLNVLVSAGADA